jgi:mRNA-degrading endonuclease RelE of RelBE toxin-antitoxin system
MGFEEGPYKIVRKNLPRDRKEVFDKKIKYLRENPNHPSLNTKQLGVSKKRLVELGVSRVYEFRINMGFRCIFYMDEKEKLIILVCVGNHEFVDRFCKD